MAKLSRDNHHIQCCQLLLEFKPKHSAGAGQIKAFRVFDHQAFIRAPASLLKTLFDLSDRMGGDYTRNLKLRRQSHTIEMFSPLAQWSCYQRLAAQPTELTGDKGEDRQS